MVSYKLTAKAINDLKNIAKYTQSNWGRGQRNVYLKQFDDAFSLLSGSPEMGQACDFVKPGYRKFPQGSHVIYYKHGSASTIEIIRILHKSMDVALNFESH